MNFNNYQLLCQAMGEVQKSGHNISDDWNMLEDAILTLLGVFAADSHDRVRALTRGEPCQPLESTAAAWDVLNGLCVKYAVSLVCDPSESAAQTAADIAKEAARLLCDSSE